ncbi:hypothetical protein POV27_00720 [Aureisphaera galaxeae]|uniref:hypothetical protein n=1 Tax=Aureisphaera galaxeae TaxID=1538023 RepID=UPI00234FE3C1|nr:hypothetical protein [Aureisphaera galaxeae]MDC8002559.1 hypothetical protein [Aureisphaera galaxeae]
MKKYFNVALGLLVILAVTIACDKDETVPTESADLVHQQTNTERGLYFPWDYVMDWRYSRLECATGPGVCFRNGYGDIFRMYTKGDDPVGEVTEMMARLMADYQDPEDGLIVFSIEGNTLNLIFSRELEEGQFIVESDEVIRGELAERLGRDQIVIPAGEYEVQYGNYEHGETHIEIE